MGVPLSIPVYVTANRYPVKRATDIGLGYGSGMTLGEKVRELREAKNWEQVDLAKAVTALGGKLSQSSVSDLERGITKRPRYLREIALALETTEDELAGDSLKPAPSLQSNVRIAKQGMQTRSPRSDDNEPPPLLMWRVSISGDRIGGWVLNANRIVGENPRSAKYLRADEAFQVEVIDSRNDPVYELSDILTIDPAKQYQIGRNHVFCGDPKKPDGDAMLLARLVKESPSEWTVRQYAGKSEIKLPKAEYPNAWRVVDRTERP